MTSLSSVLVLYIQFSLDCSEHGAINRVEHVAVACGLTTDRSGLWIHSATTWLKWACAHYSEQGIEQCSLSDAFHLFHFVSLLFSVTLSHVEILALLKGPSITQCGRFCIMSHTVMYSTASSLLHMECELLLDPAWCVGTSVKLKGQFIYIIKTYALH